MFRGSRKHILDWTGRPEFGPELVTLVAPVDCRLTAASRWMPAGYPAPEEARLDRFGPEVLPDSSAWQALRTWWLVHGRGANTPNWDVAAVCEIENRTGLILIEAKANVPELSVLGKPLAPGASANSRENHDRIAVAIADAQSGLARLGVFTKISSASHYQLSNQVAFAWKLASLGLPIVLVYLGFLGDAGISDVGSPFESSAHWESAFAKYACDVVSKNSFEKRIDCGLAPFWMLLRSRQVLQVSGAPSSQHH